ncbi:MAG: molybdopterin-dependent oxidoreductase [Rhizonema sp. NSF051]|nr:molybdopterin-dependent oxidoreductase [Rhizonema sp. NSF051]
MAAQERIQPDKEIEKCAHYSFGAHFAEVQFDPEVGELRVTRYVGAFAAGRIINPKTAHSQLIGGIIWGIGMALLEQSVVDPHLGRIVNSDLAEYLVPTNADIHPIDAFFIEEEDPRVNRIGTKGIGEIGTVGAAAAIANAVYHATGKRIRDLPITIDKLL